MKARRKIQVEFKQINWLSDKYVSLYGLRGWTWRVVIQGVIDEQVAVMNSDTSVDNSKIKIDGNL